MKPAPAAIAILIFACAPAAAHRLDEYLQGTLIAVEKDLVRAQIDLTPGVAVYPALLRDMDTDSDGVISVAEQRAYAVRVLRDLSLTIDGHRLTPRLLSVHFPGIEELRDGGGEIRIEFSADLPSGGPARKLIFENRHHSRIAAYQVNCLVPRDPDIRVAAQNRNYSQSHYELEYVQAGVQTRPLLSVWWPGDPAWLSALALLLLARFAWLWRHGRPVHYK
ncbi:MAG TPA: hypothetical protein VMJ75_14115 [Candidatus Acidoferrales bacterium]|nr:hypothetical protein [Candidatus Acidoferrales bacterium]